MSLFPDACDLSELMSRISSAVPADRLSFSIGDLEVLIEALNFYKDYLIGEEDNPDSPVFVCDDGREYLGVVYDLIVKFLRYKFT